jgi:hypothetical protein
LAQRCGRFFLLHAAGGAKLGDIIPTDIQIAEIQREIATFPAAISSHVHGKFEPFRRYFSRSIGAEQIAVFHPAWIDPRSLNV